MPSVMVEQWSTRQDLESLRRQTFGHVCEGISGLGWGEKAPQLWVAPCHGLVNTEERANWMPAFTLCGSNMTNGFTLLSPWFPTMMDCLLNCEPTQTLPSVALVRHLLTITRNAPFWPRGPQKWLRNQLQELSTQQYRGNFIENMAVLHELHWNDLQDK